MTLEKSIRRSEKWERAISAAYAALTKLDEKSPETIIELRALEANCAAAYFRAWQGMPIKWRGTSRRPVPDNWHSIEQRSSPFHLAGNRNAAHPVNAILNYAYTVLESELRIKAIADGTIQPSASCTRAETDPRNSCSTSWSRSGRRLIEPCSDFVKATVFDPADFTIRSDGVVRLNPQLARHLVGLRAHFSSGALAV